MRKKKIVPTRKKGIAFWNFVNANAPKKFYVVKKTLLKFERLKENENEKEKENHHTYSFGDSFYWTVVEPVMLKYHPRSDLCVSHNL